MKGRVIGTDGQPLKGVEVFPSSRAAFRNGFPAWPWMQAQITDSNGRFDFAAEPPLNLGFIAIHETGYVTATRELLEDLPEMKLIPWGSVRGTLWLDGLPAAPGQRVAMLFQEERLIRNVSFWADAITGPNGEFSVDRLIRGRYTIGAGQQNPDLPIVNPVGGVQWLRIEPGRVEVVELGQNARRVVGKAVAPATALERTIWLDQELEVWLHDGIRGSQGFLADVLPHGHFEIPSVPPGKWKLDLRLVGIHRDSGEVLCAALAREEVEIDRASTDPIELGTILLTEAEVDAQLNLLRQTSPRSCTLPQPQ